MTMFRTTVALVAAAGLLAAGCTSHDSTQATAGTPVPVATVPVAESDLAGTFEAGGVVRARTMATVVAKVMAEVRTVLVKPGDRVRAGQPLVILDGRELQAHRQRAEAGSLATRQSAALAEADRQAAEAALGLARVTHQRIADLRAKGSATQHELDEVVANLRGAEARLKVAEARMAEAKAAIDSAAAGAVAAQVTASYATLTAPFAGVITEKLVEPGNMASPGQPLLVVEDTGAFQVEVAVDESRVAGVHAGDAVQVRLEQAGSGGTLEGRVAEVARALDPGSHAFRVKVDLPSARDIRSGMFGRVRFTTPSRPGLGVPASAVGRRGQLAFVYVVDADKRARLRLLNAAEPVNGIVEVRSGLSAGEVVVVDPPPALHDGSPVTTTGGRQEAR